MVFVVVSVGVVSTVVVFVFVIHEGVVVVVVVVIIIVFVFVVVVVCCVVAVVGVIAVFFAVVSVVIVIVIVVGVVVGMVGCLFGELFGFVGVGCFEAWVCPVYFDVPFGVVLVDEVFSGFDDVMIFGCFGAMAGVEGCLFVAGENVDCVVLVAVVNEVIDGCEDG